MTTAWMSSGSVEKNASMPRTRGGLKALRFSGRFSCRSAISLQRSAISEAGKAQCGQGADDFGFDIFCFSAEVAPYNKTEPRGQSRGVTMSAASCDLVQPQPNLVWQTRPAADEEALHHPSEFRRGGFEARRGTEIDEVRIDGLAAHELLYRLLGPVPQAAIDDVNQRAARRFEHIFGLKLHDAVGAQNLVIGAAWKDPAAEPRAFDGAAEDGDDPPQARPRLANRGRLTDLDADVRDEAQTGCR